MTALTNRAEFLAEVFAAELVAARILAAEESAPSMPPLAQQPVTSGEGTMANLQSSYRADMAVTVSTRRLIKGLQDASANRNQRLNGLS